MPNYVCVGPIIAEMSSFNGSDWRSTLNLRGHSVKVELLSLMVVGRVGFIVRDGRNNQ